ncbi:unnamed protein product [Calypogeia fissa]
MSASETEEEAGIDEAVAAAAAIHFGNRETGVRAERHKGAWLLPKYPSANPSPVLAALPTFPAPATSSGDSAAGPSS